MTRRNKVRAFRLLLATGRALGFVSGYIRSADRVDVRPAELIPLDRAVYCMTCKRIGRTSDCCRGCESRALILVSKLIPELGLEARLVQDADENYWGS